ncbi:ribosome assembly factor SBDS [Candidatus Pacearchaeota archaeon]|jgi:ribosome maturation protein SDO1|nr:ribosome assembly factor SBDS [Candidatus Pacearchaeota archaeon]HNZ51746.1 ribosome assembly factor SBDS [Candidatus Pacearchaeota archaeon]HOF43816.1 ribosome assembly factor SBDS [Candidatus Pacearchaeota archaeon]HOR52354.1 ribosome assembly factor SBDS [Candidatus Pacearchaeota archaeon]HOU79167.1 ribosome assembly factor SBDS [Candidatus Pacearchaeota archaeon]
MTNTTARIKKTGKNFEIIVDLDDALKFKKGLSEFIQAETEFIFKDMKKGERASEKELKDAFGTTDTHEIVKKIVKEGEILTTQEYRDAEQEKKFKQVVDFLTKNSYDPQTGRPHTAERIKNALEQANVNIKNTSIENQINEILEKISLLIPIKIETKKVKIKIPALHTGKAYGVVATYKTSENWLNDGSLEVIVEVPSGMIMDFYDKLNSVTRGSAITNEIKE